MNEEAKQVLAEMMQRTLDGVDAAVEFGKAEIPAVVEQLLIWHMVESLVFFLIGVIICASVVPLYRAANKAKSNAIADNEASKPWTYWNRRVGGPTSDDYDFIVSPIPRALSFIPLFPGFLFIIINLDWLKIWIAPKLYLFEYGTSLVK